MNCPEFLPCHAGHVAPLDGQEELLLLVGEDPHLTMRTGSRIVLRHTMDTVTLQTNKNTILDFDQEKSYSIKVIIFSSGGEFTVLRYSFNCISHFLNILTLLFLLHVSKISTFEYFCIDINVCLGLFSIKAWFLNFLTVTIIEKFICDLNL